MVFYENNNNDSNNNNNNNNILQTNDFILNCNILSILSAVTYHFAKTAMYFAFVIRLRIAYDGSSYRYPDLLFSFVKMCAHMFVCACVCVCVCMCRRMCRYMHFLCVCVCVVFLKHLCLRVRVSLL